MAPVFWTHVRATAAATALTAALALPAAATAAPHWNAVKAPAPGGEDIVVANGAPTVAYTAADGVHVARGTSNGKAWQQIGAPIRRTAGAQVFQPDLALAPNGQLWVAWTEHDIDGVPQARVARFDGRRWREVVGGPRPINRAPDPGWERDPQFFGAYHPDIAFYGGRPYVAYVQANPVDDTLAGRRLSTDGTRWEEAPNDFWPGPGTVLRSGPPKLVVSGGRFYAATEDLLGPVVAVFRLDSPADRFRRIPEPHRPDFAFFGDIADLGGRPGVLFSRYSDGPLEVWALRSGDVWQQVGRVLATDGDPRGQALVSVGGVPYAAWLAGPQEARTLHIAYLRQGGSWRETPTPGAGHATSARIVADGRSAWLLWSERSANGAVSWHLARHAGK